MLDANLTKNFAMLMFYMKILIIHDLYDYLCEHQSPVLSYPHLLSTWPANQDLPGRCPPCPWPVKTLAECFYFFILFYFLINITALLFMDFIAGCQV